MNFDPEDSALIAVVAFAAAVMAGLGTFSAFSVSLSDTVQMLGGTFSLAYLVTVGAFGVTVVTNGMDVSDLKRRAEKDLDSTYYYLLIGSLAVMVAWPFVDGVSSFVQSQDLWGVLFIAGSVAAQVAIGWLK